MSNLLKNPNYLQQRLTEFYRLTGKKRFQILGNLILNDLSADAKKIVYQYERTNRDCFEMMTFHDRITNKGFYRNSPFAVEKLVEQMIEVFANARELNLI